MRAKPRQIDYKYNFQLYWSLLKKYKWMLFFVLLLTLVTEATYTLDKFLFKVVIDDGTRFAANELLKSVYVQTLLILLLIYLTSISIRTVSRWVNLHVFHKLEGNLMVDLKTKFFNHLVHLSHNFHTTHKTGSLISRLVRGGGSVERMTDLVVFNVAPLIFQVIVVGASLFYFDRASGVVLFVMAITFIGYSIFIQRTKQEANMIANDTEDIEKANISDYFTNIDSIKHFGKEHVIKRKFSRLTHNTKKAMIRNWNYFRWLDAGQMFILGVGLLLLVYFPITKFLAGALTIGTLVFIYTVYGNLIGPLFGFVHGIRQFYRSMADFESLFQYHKIENEIKDASNAKPLQIKGGSIEFRGVTFTYYKNPLLKDFDLMIQPQKKIALVGHSGSGKSTLIKLLYRLYDPERGGIYIDGKNIRECRQETLRSELSIVPQEAVLFDDTIFNNIAFSRPGAKREEVFAAMKFAQLDTLVDELPDKEKTIVGERGVRLSGGEKQRVSIARVLLADKKVLVLDEATSALDSKTEHEIQRDLERLMKGRTTIIIAHRLSTIMKADEIIVLEKGKIVQRGTHRQLILKRGVYKQLWNLQKGGYIK
ncbi:hypothetical protein CL622_06375 [archaeon]|nr:hypothetical protein [archaeon]